FFLTPFPFVRRAALRSCRRPRSAGSSARHGRRPVVRPDACPVSWPRQSCWRRRRRRAGPFPSAGEHRRGMHSTNPIERLHKEVKRRTAVVGIFPDRAFLVRLAGMLLAEQDDEWAVTDRRYVTFESVARINEPEGGEPMERLAAIA